MKDKSLSDKINLYVKKVENIFASNRMQFETEKLIKELNGIIKDGEDIQLEVLGYILHKRVGEFK